MQEKNAAVGTCCNHKRQQKCTNGKEKCCKDKNTQQTCGIFLWQLFRCFVFYYLQHFSATFALCVFAPAAFLWLQHFSTAAFFRCICFMFTIPAFAAFWKQTSKQTKTRFGQEDSGDGVEKKMEKKKLKKKPITDDVRRHTTLFSPYLSVCVHSEQAYLDPGPSCSS